MGLKGKTLFLLVIGLLLLTISGCGQGKIFEQQKQSLKLGVLPLEDILPMVVANEKGYFADENLEVELVTLQSAVESQSAIQAGQIDGMMTDMIVAALLKDAGTDLKITSVTLEATPERRRFAIVAAPGSSIQTLNDLQGKDLGIAYNSIIEYVTDNLLKKEGINPGKVNKTSIPKIPVRLEVLLNNKIEAVNIPDPLITFAEFKGAKVIVDDRGCNFSQAVLVMTGKTLREKKGALERFYRAYGKAVAEINASPEKFKETIIRHITIPEPIVEEYTVPTYPEPKLPAEAEVNNVLTWLKSKELVSQDLNYEELVEKPE